MNSDTGDMKHMKDFTDSLEAARKGYKPLAGEGTVLEILGNSFVIESYDVVSNRMILRGISKLEAKQIMIANSNK